MSTGKYQFVKIKNPPKMWWSGDPRVEKYMTPVNDALNKYLEGSQKTECYNRCYEAVYNAIKDMENE